MATILTDTVMIEGLSVSQVVWRKFRKLPIGFVEKVFDLNPSLALDRTVPVGTVVKFPIEEMDKQQTDTGLVRLWDDL